jgi:membrane associated rhomboid family serine protease
MVPLRCDTPLRRFAPATISLVVVCFVVYVQQGRWELISKGFVPLDLTHSLFYPGNNTLQSIAMLAIAFFMHANLLHLISNMWFLWIFGNAVESRLGALFFIIAYLFCGAISMAAQAAYSPLSAIPVVGASGAIAGIMGVHFVMLPLSKILVWIPPVFIIRIPAFVFLLLWFYVQYINAGGQGSAHVAWWAHIGGFAAGIGWGIYVRIRTNNQCRARPRTGLKKAKSKD